MRRGLSIIRLEHSYGLYGSHIFDRTQLAPKCIWAYGSIPEAGWSPDTTTKESQFPLLITGQETA